MKRFCISGKQLLNSFTAGLSKERKSWRCARARRELFFANRSAFSFKGSLLEVLATAVQRTFGIADGKFRHRIGRLLQHRRETEDQRSDVIAKGLFDGASHDGDFRQSACALEYRISNRASLNAVATFRRKIADFE